MGTTIPRGTLRGGMHFALPNETNMMMAAEMLDEGIQSSIRQDLPPCGL